MKFHCFFLLITLVLLSCSSSKQIAKSARENVLNDNALQTAHVGISIYEPATGKYWYNYQGDKYFVPASNTKLPTCYAAMKYLGDSLVGLRYDELSIQATGDPTFLLEEFKRQPVLEFLKKNSKYFILDYSNWNNAAWGLGWSISDYAESYMPERSPLPMYGNVIKMTKGALVSEFTKDSSVKRKARSVFTYPRMFEDSIKFLGQVQDQIIDCFDIDRNIGSNNFDIRCTTQKFSSKIFPYVTYGFNTATKLLLDTLKRSFALAPNFIRNPQKIYSQPTDSLLKPMMHRSDNFFAEQTLLMVSNELLGVMNDEKIIDTLLKTDFKNLPQKPRWVDGSGLSRYNLFTPQDFVFILNKMKTDFGMDRIKNILPTGNDGTLEGRFVADSNYIFAKTGTLSGVVSLSGFLYTKKNKLLIFSVLVNNHNSSASQIRKAVEKFVEGVRNKF
jgi:D-alanyl-D-alanine carboxypeptidase/D-alanyl-D-alanine-endopeptidase (penicillin-binding protein 4)